MMNKKYLKKGYHLVLRGMHIFTPIYYMIFPLNRWKNSTKLEIGCGSVRRIGWLSLDYRPGADVTWDLTKRLPFENNFFEHIYSSHVLEHFEFNDMKFLLSELNRILKPNGKMSICVPDASMYVNAYIKKNSDVLLQHKPAITSDRPMDYLNYIFYMNGEHKFMFEADNLRYHLENSGFDRFNIRPIDLQLDGKDREYESLYAECYKPNSKL